MGIPRATASLLLAISVTHAAAEDDNRPARRDVVLHAGGVVEFQLPEAWQLSEVPVGREIRLVLTHGDDERDKNAHDAFWMTFHVDRRGTPLGLEKLRMWLARRSKQLDQGNTELGEPQRLVVDNQIGFVQPYTTTLQRGTRHRSGQRIAVAAAWGILEVHWQSDPAQQTSYQQAAAKLLRSVRFNEPLGKHVVDVEPSCAGAREIFGSWKAFRSRLTLSPDGGIIIVPDAKRIQLGHNPHVQQLPIVGKFESRDDLLIVRWNDGSRLNFRWALLDGTLLLTDHNGQTTRLNPLLD